MTGNEIEEIVRQRIVDDGGAADDPRLSKTLMRQLLNLGAREYYRKTGAGQNSAQVPLGVDAEFNIPSDFVRPNRVFDDQGVPIPARSRAVIVRMRAESTATRPTAHVVYGDKYIFAPRLSVACVVTNDYYSTPAEIVDMAAQTGLRSGAEDAVIEFMTWKAWLALEEPTQAAIAKGTFDEAIEEAEEEFEEIELEDLFDEDNHEWRRS